jgi:hypothetical protein
VFTTIGKQGGTKPTTITCFGISDEWATYTGQIPIIPHQFQSKEKKKNKHQYAIVLLTLLQKTSIVSAGKVSLVSARQADTIYTIRKRRSF